MLGEHLTVLCEQELYSINIDNFCDSSGALFYMNVPCVCGPSREPGGAACMRVCVRSVPSPSLLMCISAPPAGAISSYAGILKGSGTAGIMSGTGSNSSDTASYTQ